MLALALRQLATLSRSAALSLQIAARFALGTLGAVQIVDTDAGPSIVAVNNERKAGKTTYFALEKRSNRYRVVAQGPLDLLGFRGALWSSEILDAEEDGYQDVLFSGRDAQDNRTQRQLVLFVPNDRRTYTMRVSGETTASGTPRITWLANAAGIDAAPYRTLMRQKAKALAGKR